MVYTALADAALVAPNAPSPSLMISADAVVLDVAATAESLPLTLLPFATETADVTDMIV